MKKLLTFTLLLATLVTAGCAEVDLTKVPDTSAFQGIKGEFIALENNKITLEASEINDGQAHYHHTVLPSGDIVYFFVVKSPDGKLRAAANGCQVCGKAMQGFRQEGDTMVCNTCGNKYALNKIATEKGGCNPAPISPDLQIKDGKITITLDELENVKQYFK